MVSARKVARAPLGPSSYPWAWLFEPDDHQISQPKKSSGLWHARDEMVHLIPSPLVSSPPSANRERKKKLTGTLTRMMAHLSTSMTPPPLLILGKHILPQHAEMGLVRRQAEHDQIGVEAIDDMFGVGVVRGVRPLAADKVHNLVLAFPGHGGVGNDDFQLLVL